MQSFRIALALGLAAAGVAQAAQACPRHVPLDPRDVREAEVVLVGRLSGYRTVLDQKQRRWNRERLGAASDDSQGLMSDYVVFDVAVQDTLVGQSPRRIRVTWNNSTFGEPEEMPDGRYLMALRRAQPGAPSAPDFTVFQHPCSSAFLFRNGSPGALAALRVLAGEEPYPADPPSPPPSLDDVPRRSFPPGYVPDPPKRAPAVYLGVFGVAGLGLLVALGALAWGRKPRRPDDEDTPPDA